MIGAGREDSTEFIGTEGKLTVNIQPASNLVKIYQPGGMRYEISKNYYCRFKEAFVTEANEFVACCKRLPMKLSETVQAGKAGAALQESIISGRTFI
jgi:myo-inositol 2-dehydrogenase/D-chiro-inositol 1-dehydrogenase